MMMMMMTIGQLRAGRVTRFNLRGRPREAQLSEMITGFRKTCPSEVAESAIPVSHSTPRGSVRNSSPE
eukprot:1536295-Karenia_brevis.AAC.1